MAEDIQFVGLKELDAMEIEKLQSLSEKHFSKIRRDFTNGRLVVNIKKGSSKAGDTSDKRARYEISLRLDAPALICTAGHSDWELERAIHRSFNALQNEAKHKFEKKEAKRNRAKLLVKESEI